MQSLLRRTLQAGARLGPRAGVVAGAAALLASTATLDAPAAALSPGEFKPFKLAKIEKVSHDTSLYRCACDRASVPQGRALTRSHVALRCQTPRRRSACRSPRAWSPSACEAACGCATQAQPVAAADLTGRAAPATCATRRANIGEGGKPVIRPYTPVSHPDEKGHFDLVVKARRASLHRHATPPLPSA